ncbi:MAG: hypothetical protein ABUT20_45520, partial [Bacteroidota bacterium]
FAPVCFMLKALKNDIVAIEYPINYFISQCIHNGEVPLWFNTWGMGFPLQSNLTWGIYSTPQMFFSAIFNYDIFSLHIEFMFFVLMSGWGMYHLLKKHFLKDETISVILACCYMLSGFVIGSAQWMLYITAASLTPFVLSALLQLLRFPSFRHALLFAVLYYIMFTSVYPAFTIITSYCLFIFTISDVLRRGSEKSKKATQLKYLGLAVVITSLLCLPCILTTLELLKFMNRGTPLSINTRFFNSNYLPPNSLSSMLLPFSSARMHFPNTEATMFNTYAGLFTLLILPPAIAKTIKEKNRPAFIMLLAGIFFLLVSFGSILPIRNALNILPGFSYFRNSGLFRFHFILFLILYLANVFRNASWPDIFDLKKGTYARYLNFSFIIIFLLCLVCLIIHFAAAKNISFSNIPLLIKKISYSQTIFINVIIQIVLIIAIFFSSLSNKYQLAKFFILAELIINSLLCTPYLVVGSYSLQQVNAILHSEKGFPVQQKKINEVAATYTDEKLNRWNNVNIFQKQVSSKESYKGPLILNGFSFYNSDNLKAGKNFNKQVVFAENTNPYESIQLLLQKPTYIKISVKLSGPNKMTLMQNNYPGWKAWYNNKRFEILKDDSTGISINVPKGDGLIEFRYERKSIWMIALLMHLFIITLFVWELFSYLKNKKK